VRGSSIFFQIFYITALLPWIDLSEFDTPPFTFCLYRLVTLLCLLCTPITVLSLLEWDLIRDDIDILLRVNAEESRAVEISGLQPESPPRYGNLSHPVVVVGGCLAVLFQWPIEANSYQSSKNTSSKSWSEYPMKCERCGEDTSVSQYEVDDFTGYLCKACVETWDEITDYS